MTDSTAEVPLPPIEPGGPTAEAAPLALEPARWSVATRRRLLIALIGGSVVAVLGAVLFFPAQLQGLDDVLTMYLGLALLPISLGLAGVAARTLPMSPDQRYQPRPVNTPRNLFAVIWLAGVIAPIVLHIESAGDLKIFSLVALTAASALVLSGGRWAFRWFTNKLDDEWPTGRSDAPVAVPLIWPRRWAIGWAGLFGVLAGVLAAIVEIAAIWVTAKLLEPLLVNWQPTFLDTNELFGEILSQPLFVLGILVAVAVIAPAIEEACKALGLRLMRSIIRQPSDGLMLGMLMGLGFGLMESGLYLSSMSGWLLAGWLRFSTLFLHGIATSIVGVAYARSLISGQRRVVAAGYGRAVMLHGTWNASAIGIGLGFANASSWWLGIICLGVLIFLIARMIPRTVLAGVQTAVQDGYQQAGADLPPEWSPSDNNLGWRLMGSRPQLGVRVARETPQPTATEPTPSNESEA